MRKARAGLWAAGIVAGLGLASACTLVSGIESLNFDGTDGGSSSSSGNSSTGGTGSSSTGSSSSGGCTSASQCPGPPPGPCASLGMATCTVGTCNLTYTKGAAPSQVYGSCKKNMCDANGNMTSVADDTNVYQSGDDCIVYACADGGVSDPSQLGATCTFKVMPPNMVVSGVCQPSIYGNVVCAQCSASSSSACTPATQMCVGGMCVSTTCVGCGGPMCDPCGTGKACNGAADCYSNVCSGTPKVCQQASCSDGIRNGVETDIDCGGSGGFGCPPCSAGGNCVVSGDCQSGVCMPNDGGPNTCQAPTCTDGVMNGTETGVDCGGTGDVDGGAPCPPCPDAGP